MSDAHNAEYVAPLDEAWLAEEWTFLAEKESGTPWRSLSSGIVTNAVLRTLRYLGYGVGPTLPDGSFFFNEEGWTVTRDIKGRGWKVSRIDGDVCDAAL